MDHNRTLKNDLEATRKATLCLQDRLLTAGDLLAEWELMEFLCGVNDKSSFSYFLKGALQARKRTVIDNDALLGAVYVD